MQLLLDHASSISVYKQTACILVHPIQLQLLTFCSTHNKFLYHYHMKLL